MDTTAPCVFCLIVAGELPARVVHDSPDVIAFLDLGPAAPGHTLVVPKSHHADLLDTPADLLGQVLAVAQEVARAQVRELGADGVLLTQATGAAAGQEVFHLHVHVVPRHSGDDIFPAWGQPPWTPPALSAGELDHIAAQLRGPG